jgi:hypothetical protein
MKGDKSQQWMCIGQLVNTIVVPIQFSYLYTVFVLYGETNIMTAQWGVVFWNMGAYALSILKFILHIF